MPGQPDNTVAIVSILSSGVITPSIVAWYALRARRRDERRAEHDHELAVLEEALNNVSRERRLLHSGLRLWLDGVSYLDPRNTDNHQAVTEAIEAVWISENQVRIRFGDEAPVAVAFQTLQTALGRELKLYRRRATLTGHPTPEDERDCIDAHNGTVPALNAFVETVRMEMELERANGGRWSGLRLGRR